MYDDDDDGRDARGRWKKGHCPNLKGRPRKKTPISESDVYHFKETMVDAVIGGRPTKISRAALLLHKMFEGALKGSVLIQRKLFERFEQSDDTVAEGEFHLRRLGNQITEQYNTTGTFDERLYEEYSELHLLVRRRPHYEAVNEAQRRPRDRRKPAPPITPTWRKGPKPQAILDLEAEWAAAEAAEKAAKRMKKTGGSDDR